MLLCHDSRDSVYMFWKIFQIPVFARFRKWKAFSIWRKNVQRKKIASCKRALNENLFIVDEVKIIFVPTFWKKKKTEVI